ncbi:hypothetical protein SAMN05216353_10226 [Halobacillus alkaliphilus]|uniref:Uncharacterized protein n=1 Tax=Halobacillus alkaliphilus TaxID=396056 RepID=A0A1I2JW85_9BACI|nr:hypothetical protein SAMN05216353_10226 [Halobacillus alkaliphilus]
MGVVIVLFAFVVISLCSIALGLLFTRINFSFGLAISASLPFIVGYLLQVTTLFYLIPILPLVTWIVHSIRVSREKPSFK